MKPATTKRTLAILSAAIGVLFFAACEQGGTAETNDHSAYNEVSPDQLEQLMNAGVVLAYDANGAETRSEFGVVPGAKMLSNHKTYDVSAELPSDRSKQIVFYCANTMCSAAPTAARRAQHAGYTNVGVMPVGIQGWVKAGKPVQQPAVG